MILYYFSNTVKTLYKDNKNELVLASFNVLIMILLHYLLIFLPPTVEQRGAMMYQKVLSLLVRVVFLLLVLILVINITFEQ